MGKFLLKRFGEKAAWRGGNNGEIGGGFLNLIELLNLTRIIILRNLEDDPMHKDQFMGSPLLVSSVTVTIVYMWLAFFPPLHGADIFILKLTGAVAAAAAFAIPAWIGYTLATTPPPKPIEEIGREVEGEGRRALKAG